MKTQESNNTVENHPFRLLDGPMYNLAQNVDLPLHLAPQGWKEKAGTAPPAQENGER